MGEFQALHLLVRDREEDRRVIFCVAKSIRQVLQVDGLLGDGITGFVTNQNEVNSGLASKSSSVGGPKRSVPGVDGCKPMLSK